jgi:hypothetical protein
MGALERAGYTYKHVVEPLEHIGYKVEFLAPDHSFDKSAWPQLDILLKI